MILFHIDVLPRMEWISFLLMLPSGASSSSRVNSLRSRKSVPLLTIRMSPLSPSAPRTGALISYPSQEVTPLEM